MPRNGYENGVHSNDESEGGCKDEDSRPTYALEHLATFKLKNEAEIKKPKEKVELLIELDKTGGIWPHKMFMCFNGQWLVMLDSEMKEIENFPGSLITEPTAFISDDPMESFNNILIFSVPGISLGNTEMHIFQVSDVSSVHLVEDLRQLSRGTPVTVDRNTTPIRVHRPDRPHQPPKDQFGIAAVVAGIAAEKNANDREQTERDVLVLNHCFEDIERFIARLHYAGEALIELESRKEQHNPHGEGLLVLRSRPPIESEFHDIFSKIKLALNYSVKLQNSFTNGTDPIHNIFISLQTIVNVCNDVYMGLNLPQSVVNPLLQRETVTFLTHSLDSNERELWHSLGSNWIVPKNQFKDHKGSYHPIFYDDWSPDWVVDEEVPYLAPAIKKPQTPTPTPPSPGNNRTWLSRLQSRNVNIAEVTFNKAATNDRELNVTKGEYLEIIDNSRNWWKARNSYGNVGYVPHTVLTPYNFEHIPNRNGRDTDSVSSMTLVENGDSNPLYRNTLAAYLPPADRESQQSIISAKNMSRSYSMPPIVPIPPPMPPPSESQPTTPSGTLKRNMATAGTLAAMRARNDCDADDEAYLLQGDVNDELRMALQQRQRRKDLEILKTPEIYITQNSKPNEVEEWLRGKGFSDNIVKRLKSLNGEEIFALSPHTIESYFGQRESRRLISQIVLQKNFCEYKTIRSSELSAKLARARQKADQSNVDPNEVF